MILMENDILPKINNLDNSGNNSDEAPTTATNGSGEATTNDEAVPAANVRYDLQNCEDGIHNMNTNATDNVDTGIENTDINVVDNVDIGSIKTTMDIDDNN
ncbi:6686_t:CDS:2 [Ambispora gerdemannii]|uniref:6686_t:CDS:1 n=1 Tax=Ambispora gerdemannii TaxID=144530 RepID=A0A9N9ANN9_9GLOM|nr:6686_t:CDS:2 [Ambispora gerdemannii]